MTNSFTMANDAYKGGTRHPPYRSPPVRELDLRIRDHFSLSPPQQLQSVQLRPALEQPKGKLPPIQNLLAVYHDAVEKKQRMRLSNSPRAASEYLGEGPDSIYTLSNDQDYSPPLRQTPYGWEGERDREERSSQVPRGYSGSMPFSMHDTDEPGYTEPPQTGSVGSSPPSSSAYSNTVAESDWYSPGHNRRSAPHPMTASEWERAQDHRRYADAQYAGPGNQQGALPLPMRPTDDRRYRSPPAQAAPYGGRDAYQQQHHSRGHSLSQSLSANASARGYDRAAFPPSALPTAAAPYDRSRSTAYMRSTPEYYGGGGGDYRNRGPAPGQANGQGGLYGGVSGGRIVDNKQRKRRGNLPKETTDKLRLWFQGHLHHPYPTEDEKQELMHQTGLQMNQISNWFINARRRHLPSLINQRLVEGALANGRPGSMDTVRNSNPAAIAPSGMPKGYMQSSDHMYAAPSRAYGPPYDHAHETGPSLIYSRSSTMERRRISSLSDEDL